MPPSPRKEKHSRFGSVTNLFFSKLKGDKKAKSKGTKRKGKKVRNGTGGNVKKKRPKNAVFGVDPAKLESVQCDEYASPIPLVLSRLKSELFMNDGHLLEGIFRVAPNATECKRVEEELDGGGLHHIRWDEVGASLIANLIKIWFRLLPNPVLQGIDSAKIEKVQSTQSVADAESVVMEELVEPQRSYFLWLLDLCIDITAHEADNKMSPKNMAVVVAPNLYDPTRIANPMKAMTISQAIVQLIQIAIEWRTQSADRLAE